jgi:hypothetical protein
MPRIRDVVRESLAGCNAVAPAANGLPFEFCSSVNPHEAVAQGLAIRGAVLMGTNQGRLRDLLMLDALPNTVGLLLPLTSAAAQSASTEGRSSRNGSGSGSGSGSGGTGGISLQRAQIHPDQVQGAGCSFYGDQQLEFHPLLLRGARIPSRHSKSFTADASVAVNKRVTLCIAEELPSGSTSTSTPQENEAAAGGGGRGKGNKKKHASDYSAARVPRYEIVGTYDFPVSTVDSGTVDVSFSVNENGEMGFSVNAHAQTSSSTVISSSSSSSDGSSSGVMSEDAASTGFTRREWMLIIYGICMFLLYIGIKATLGSTPDGTSTRGFIPPPLQAAPRNVDIVDIPQEL